MPSNAAVLEQLKNEAIYGKEALARVVPLLKSALGAAFEFGSDALALFHGTVTALAAGGEIRTNGGVKIYAVHVQQQATATQDVVVRFFNTSTASTALTTTAYGTSKDALSVPCGMTGGSKTIVLLPNALEFQTAASYAVVSAAALDTAAVATSAPTVTVLYAPI